MPTQGKSRSVKVMPKLEGFKKCLRLFCTATRNNALELMAAAVAKTIGMRRELEDSSMEQAIPVMCADKRKSTTFFQPPENLGLRRCTQQSTSSNQVSQQ